MDKDLCNWVTRLVQNYESILSAPKRRPLYQHSLAEIEAEEPELQPLALQREC